MGTRLLEYNDSILINTDDFELLKENEEISLISWCNAFVNNSELTLYLDGDFKNTKKKIVWISSKNTIDVKIDFCDGYNPIKSSFYIGESSLLEIKKGDYVQFMKMNYYMCTGIDLDKLIISFVELN